MAFQKLRRVENGDIITAADMNDWITATELAHQRVEAVEAHRESPSMTDLVATAAIASASQVQLTRRQLFGLGRKG